MLGPTFVETLMLLQLELAASVVVYDTRQGAACAPQIDENENSHNLPRSGRPGTSPMNFQTASFAGGFFTRL